MSLVKNFRNLLVSRSRPTRLGVQAHVQANFSSAVEKKIEPTEAVYATLADEEETDEMMIEREMTIQALRNKSRLNPAHYNMLHGKVPYDEPKCETHLTLLYRKRMFGRYGRSSGLDPGYLWPTPEEINRKLEYDRIANPYSVLELAARERAKIEQNENEIQLRQAKIAENVKKLEQWKREVKERAAKRLAEVVAAKAKKEALLEEVRRHFGFKIDPKDERFKEVLLQKERAMKKKLKEEKSKAKQERLMQSMVKPES